MRGKRRILASALADALCNIRAAEPAAIAAAFAEAVGARLSRELSFRGVLRDGRLLVVARTPAWGAQASALAPTICARVNARLGRQVARDLDVHVGAPEL
jgi:hypothetical protein